MEIRLAIDSEFMKRLSGKLNDAKPAQLTRDALTLLNWAADEVKNGRVILSGTSEGNDLKQLAMPALDEIRKEPA